MEEMLGKTLAASFLEHGLLPLPVSSFVAYAGCSYCSRNAACTGLQPCMCALPTAQRAWQQCFVTNALLCSVVPAVPEQLAGSHMKVLSSFPRVFLIYPEVAFLMVGSDFSAVCGF